MRGDAVSEDALELGPVDIVVIGFPPDAPRTGESIPIFTDLVDRGVIRVLDVMMIQKDDSGTVTRLEITDVGGRVAAELTVFDGAQTGMLDDEDAALAADALEPGEAAVLLCFENTWAAPFVTSVSRNGGRVLAFQRVSAQDIIDTVNAIDAAESAS
jgi:hypothetical protein